MLKEEWKDVVGYENTYQVSNTGKVKSLCRISTNRNGKTILKEKILKGSPNGQKYLCVKLYKNHKYSTAKIHRLVAEAFLPNPLSKPEVNHTSGDKNKNSVLDLEWATPKENTVHAHANGLVKKNVGYEHHKSKTVVMCDLNGKFVKEYGSTRQVEKDGLMSSTVSLACRGLLKKGNIYKDHIWSYKDLV